MHQTPESKKLREFLVRCSMLKKLTLHNFKSTDDLKLALGPLTVLTGLNGSGKSSVLQSIALLKQSLDADSSGRRMALRGPWVHLGRSEDVLFDGAKTESLALALHFEDKVFQWQCDAPSGRDTLDASLQGDISALTTVFDGFQFLQADRLTPAIQYQQAGTADRDCGSLGPHGEFTVDFLSRHEDMKVSNRRRYPEARLRSSEDLELMRSVAPTDRLWDVTSAWLQLLSPGVRPVASLVDLADAATLRFAYKGYKDIERDVTSREHRPSNVGFGLTYSLPIIVACLSAKAGALLLLENPEAHLHPRGQSALGLLLALCASDGVQVIVETHSDHLLNGIRLAAKRKDIMARDVAVHFFSRSVETGVSTCESPVLLDNGRFSDWPAGFFDEWGNALDELLED
jgi:predicted ATPase